MPERPLTPSRLGGTFGPGTREGDAPASGILGSGWRRSFRVACLIASLLLSSSCSKEKQYRKRMSETIGNARRTCRAWKTARHRELYPNGRLIIKKERALVDRIESEGLDWLLDGKEISYREVIEGASEDAADRSSHLDGWGQPFEYRIVDGFLVIRSSGSDRVFESERYQYGTFPWLSGGDIVIVGNSSIRWANEPRSPDWLKDAW